jgi:hypothetical protein
MLSIVAAWQPAIEKFQEAFSSTGWALSFYALVPIPPKLNYILKINFVSALAQSIVDFQSSIHCDLIGLFWISGVVSGINCKTAFSDQIHWFEFQALEQLRRFDFVRQFAHQYLLFLNLWGISASIHRLILAQ